MPVNTDNLSAKQEDAVLALLHEPSIGKAAESVGVDEKTIRRWLKEPDFERAHREARRETFRQAMSLTQRYAPVAVQALLKIVADQKVAPAARVSAALGLLRFLRESIELDDLAARVEAIERIAPAAPHYPRDAA